MSRLHDPYAKGPGEEAGQEPASVVRTAGAVLLLVLGIVICIWVAVQIVTMLGGSDPPGLVTAVLGQADEEVAIGVGEEQITLSPGALRIVGYVLAFLLLGIAASMGVGVIKGGVSLLQPDWVKVLRKMMAGKGEG